MSIALTIILDNRFFKSFLAPDGLFFRDFPPFRSRAAETARFFFHVKITLIRVMALDNIIRADILSNV